MRSKDHAPLDGGDANPTRPGLPHNRTLCPTDEIAGPVGQAGVARGFLPSSLRHDERRALPPDAATGPRTPAR